MFKVVKFIKGALLLIPVTLVLLPFTRFFLFVADFNRMLLFIYKNRKHLILNDFYSFRRDYNKRYTLYKAVSAHYGLGGEKISYLEFGVASGASFRWWLEENKHPGSVFTGFDTFTGLPESWGGLYAKGAMQADVPVLTDTRTKFVKGLFQDTLHGFIMNNRDLLLQENRKIIHLDADLYSSTLFTLSQLYPYIRKGDLLLFDEFNVPLHEFKAYKEFTEAFYVRLKPVAAVNNFYQAAFIAE